MILNSADLTTCSRLCYSDQLIFSGRCCLSEFSVTGSVYKPAVNLCSNTIILVLQIVIIMTAIVMVALMR